MKIYVLAICKLIGCSFYLAAFPAFAQDVPFERASRVATITGRVFGPDGAVAYARVTLGTNSGAHTDTTGGFSIESRKFNRQTLQVRALGYEPFDTLLDVRAASRIELSIRLKEAPLSTETMVVSGARYEMSRKASPVVVNVIDDQIFNATQSVSLAEGISFTPGLRLETNCQNCGFTQVRMNGLGGAYSQILINNRPIFSALTGVYGLDMMPANMIDRVEVVRGGGSSLYGANAIAGTINIITKDPVNNTWQAGTNLGLINGEHADHVINANASLVSDDLSSGLNVYGMFRNRDAYDANGDEFTEITAMENNTFGVGGFFKPSERSRVSVDAFTMQEYRRGGNNLERPPHEADIAEELRHRILGGNINYEQYTANMKHKFSAYVSGQFVDRDSYYGAGQDLDAYGTTDDETFVAGAQHTFMSDSSFWNGFAVTTGAEYQHNAVTDRMLGYERLIDQTVDVFGMYAQVDLPLTRRLRALAGVRVDEHNLLDELAFNPRFNLKYDFGGGLQARAGYAVGYRAPQAFDEDLHIASVGGEAQLIQLSDELEAERSQSLNASLDYTLRKNRFYLNVLFEPFYTRLVDAFALEETEPDPEGNMILLKTNGEGATVAGFSLTGRFAWEKSITLDAGATMQEARYDDPVAWSDESGAAEDRILRAPDLYGYFVATYDYRNTVQFSISGNYTGPMLVPRFAGYVAEDVLVASDPFFELNLKAAYKINLGNVVGMKIYAGCQNILNAYQPEFDRGPERDAGFIYGPSRPITPFFGIVFGNDAL